MQIKHTLEASDDECTALFTLVKTCCLTPYPSKDAQDKALDACAVTFRKMIDEHTNNAFQLGYKVGLNSANVKDDEMYK